MRDTDGTVLDPDRVDVLFTARVSTEQRAFPPTAASPSEPCSRCRGKSVYAAGRAATD